MKKYEGLSDEFTRHLGVYEYTIEEFLDARLSGEDYDRGELETLKASNRELRSALSRLCEVLVEKTGTLSINQIYYIGSGRKGRE